MLLSSGNAVVIKKCNCHQEMHLSSGNAVVIRKSTIVCPFLGKEKSELDNM